MEGGAGGLRQRRSEVVEQPVAAEGQEGNCTHSGRKGEPIIIPCLSLPMSFFLIRITG